MTDPAAQTEQFRQRFTRVREELARMIVGQSEIVEAVLVAFFAAGHVLLEGVPGLGKTMLVRTLAEAVDAKFSRVQFTPDLMPSDIIGTNIISRGRGMGRKGFRFQAGPVFANILLADEINRATPKTQSALLEAMQEKHVTVAGETHRNWTSRSWCWRRRIRSRWRARIRCPKRNWTGFLFKLKVGNIRRRRNLHMPFVDRTTQVEARAATLARSLTGPEILALAAHIVRDVPMTREIQAHAIAISSLRHTRTTLPPRR